MTYTYDKLDRRAGECYNGVQKATYTYDAWGNFTETVHSTTTEATLASDLPFRYRGYYYDEEIGLYYLNTRYYDASIGRFINADDISYLGANGDFEAYNLYAYCSNNPVMGYDPMGEWTYSGSLGFSAFFVTGFSYSISWSIDSHGNFVIQKTKANFSDEGGIIGLCSIGVSNSTSVTKLDSVYDLEGK